MLIKMVSHPQKVKTRCCGSCLVLTPKEKKQPPPLLLTLGEQINLNSIKRCHFFSKKPNLRSRHV